MNKELRENWKTEFFCSTVQDSFQHFANNINTVGWVDFVLFSPLFFTKVSQANRRSKKFTYKNICGPKMVGESFLKNHI